MINRLLFSISIFVLVFNPGLVSWADGGPVFYVSPNGNDTWSGTLPETNSSGTDGPWASPEYALEALRSLRPGLETSPSYPIKLIFQGGIYELTEPLTLKPEDSGTASAPLILAAYGDEEPVFSGGVSISGWKEVHIGKSTLWAVSIPQAREHTWDFRELWVNGERRLRARHPNRGYLQIAGLPDVTKETPWNQGQQRFAFHPGDIRHWSNLDDVEVVPMHLWVAVRLHIAGIDEKNNIVTFTKPSRRRLSLGFDHKIPAPYYVENAFELLDEPGEWYLDRKTGTLYYAPMPGESINNTEIIAPWLKQALVFEGKPESGDFVEYIYMRGLTFSHTEYRLDADDPGDTQAAIYVPGAVYGEGVRRCIFEDCTVAHVGNYGLELARGCHENRIANCDIFDTAAGGIKIGEGKIRENTDEQTFRNEIYSTHIHDGGHIYHQGIGVWIGQSGHNCLSHCEIDDFYYSGISVGWTWGYKETLAQGNIIEFNNIHHIGSKANREEPILSDMGGIYTLGTQPGTIIRGNTFHDIAARDYGGWGIYFDEGSTHIVAEKNLVYRTSHGGFHQHYGKENIVRNNIFAYGTNWQIQRSREEEHKSFTFEKNIVYWNEGKLLSGRWDKNFEMHDNLYWQADGQTFQFGNRTWEEWLKAGFGKGSVIEDPRFANPGTDNFSITDNSSVDKIGFIGFDATKNGLIENG